MTKQGKNQILQQNYGRRTQCTVTIFKTPTAMLSRNLSLVSVCIHEPMALDRRLVQKVSKCQFFQDIKRLFHRITQMGQELHHNFFRSFFTNMVARQVQS